MNRPAPPDLSKVSDQLAASNARVTRFLAALPQRVDDLIDAMQADDWGQVHCISRYLMDSSRAYGQSQIQERADEVCQCFRHRGDRQQLKRHVIRLISACGTSH